MSADLALRDDLEPMTAQECAQVIGVAAAADNRVPQPSPEMLRVWWAILRRVPAEAAVAAIMDWYGSERYRETRESITPADIAGWWRDRRRHAEETRPRPEFDAERVHAGVDEVFAALAARKAISAGLDPETAVDAAASAAAERRLLRSVPCPWEPCRAGVGRDCCGPGGRPLSGDRVHGSRRDVALDAAGFSHA